MKRTDSVAAMSRATFGFCCFITAVLLLLAWLMHQIEHTPWGLLAAAAPVLALTVQQLMRDPSPVCQEPLENAN